MAHEKSEGRGIPFKKRGTKTEETERANKVQ